ncbi:glycosyltransferase [Desulfovibrio sp. SGI.169]|uniref:glycosyltransferase n=1 Tax=Desulfovibrio sp. SGI.169 TaxID=3420561 RepID=UPI003D005781
MKTVLFLDQYGGMGGGQRVLLALAQAARDAGWRVEALLPSGPCAEALTRMGARVRVTPECRLREGRKGPLDALALLWHTLRVFCGHLAALRGADLLYANGGRMYPLCFMASLLLRRPAAYHVHLNPGDAHMRVLRLLLRSRLTRRIALPSRYIERVLHKAGAAFGDARARLVENGLDERFDGVVFKDRFTGRPLRHVGVVGRVCAEKGQDALLPLAAALPRMHFHVLGDAAFYDHVYFEELKARAPSNVHFYGWVEDIPGKADEIGLQVCLVPSRCPAGAGTRLFEASPLVPLQMMALSCLVIPRRLGVLADMAERFGLPAFEKDDELPALLRDLAAQDGAMLAAGIRENMAVITREYSHAAFQRRLRDFFAELD